MYQALPHSLFYFHLNIIYRQVLLLSPFLQTRAWGPKNVKHTLYQGLQCFPHTSWVFGSAQDRHLGEWPFLPSSKGEGQGMPYLMTSNLRTVWYLRLMGAGRLGEHRSWENDPSYNADKYCLQESHSLRGTENEGDWSTTGVSLSRADDS